MLPFPLLAPIIVHWIHFHPATIPNKGNQGLARTSPGKECPASTTNVWETQPGKGVIYNINLVCTRVYKTIILYTTLKI